MVTSPGGGSRYMLMRCATESDGAAAGAPRPLAWAASQAMVGTALQVASVPQMPLHCSDVQHASEPQLKAAVHKAAQQKWLH